MILKYQISSFDDTDVVWQYEDGITRFNSWFVSAGDAEEKISKLINDGAVYQQYLIKNIATSKEGVPIRILYVTYKNGDTKWMVLNGNCFVLNDNGKTIERL